jgi:hypothetical protein
MSAEICDGAKDITHFWTGFVEFGKKIQEITF